MFIHLAQLANFVIPFAGMVLSIVLWQTKRNDLPGIDPHGKMALNWMISALIYGVVGFVLAFVLIGFPILLALGVVAVVFPIIAGIKANNGEFWVYPLAIPFIK